MNFLKKKDVGGIESRYWRSKLLRKVICAVYAMSKQAILSLSHFISLLFIQATWEIWFYVDCREHTNGQLDDWRPDGWYNTLKREHQVLQPIDLGRSSIDWDVHQIPSHFVRIWHPKADSEVVPIHVLIQSHSAVCM